MAAGEAEVIRKALIESVAEGMRDAFVRIMREVAAEMGADRMAWVESHRLLDDLGAARLLETTPETLRELRATRGLPFIVLGPRNRRYERAALLAWIEANTERGEVAQ